MNTSHNLTNRSYLHKGTREELVKVHFTSGNSHTLTKKIGKHQGICASVTTSYG